MKKLNVEQMENVRAGGHFWDDFLCGMGGGMNGAIIGALIGGPVGFVTGLVAGTLMAMGCSAGARIDD